MTAKQADKVRRDAEKRIAEYTKLAEQGVAGAADVVERSKETLALLAEVR